VWKTLYRALVIQLYTLFALAALQAMLPGFVINGWGTWIISAVSIGLLNTFVFPVLLKMAIRLIVLSFSLTSFVLNGVCIWIAHRLLSNFTIDDPLTGLVVAFGLMAIITLAISLLYDKKERDFYEFNVIRRFNRKYGGTYQDRTPGLILLEIDGLSEPVLQKAIRLGYMPTLASWLKNQRYRIFLWDSGLPSQTSAMQAGIMHGRHYDIPAFRYYDKTSRRMLSSNNPWDASEISRSISDGNGLLKNRGFSINNWACGDAEEMAFTFTSMTDPGRGLLPHTDYLYTYFADFNNFQNAFVAFVKEVLIEWREAYLQRRRDVQPRVDRRGLYPLIRAVTTAVLPQLSTYILINKLFEGIAIAYATYVAYDEVAHHSGIDRPETLRVLTKLDDQIRWIANATQYTQRPYEMILLSDHGQSQGATFNQRYGSKLEDLVSSLLEPDYAAPPAQEMDESVAAINLMLTELAYSGHFVGRPLQRVLRHKTQDGFIELGKPYDSDQQKAAKTVVCVSGNLALIYFTEWTERLTFERVQARFSGFLEGLVAHPGIGFVMVDTESQGPMVLGKSGILFLQNGFVRGVDPLREYGRHAPRHLLELNSYPRVGDIIVNSVYDPKTGEVAAFEELVGSHGGLGGLQNQPFLMVPSFLQPDDLDEIVGAPQVYHLIRRWMEQLPKIRRNQTSLNLYAPVNHQDL
jgi:uncharacterized membrane protein YvlD (DUF360 family)